MSDSLLSNARRLEAKILERMRGPAMVILTKVASSFLAADAQPVVKIKAANGQTVTAGATSASPVLVWGSGGFELSACIDQGDVALSLPLESDHTSYLKTGKISDPASPRVHDRGLAVSLLFGVRKALAAGEGELYLGHPGKGLYIKINRESAVMTLEVAGASASIKIGAAAARGAARLNDDVTMSAALMTYLTTLAGAVPSPAPPPGMTIGTISSASSKVVIE